MTRSIFTTGITFLVLASLATSTYGQFTSASGARAIAMGNSFVSLQDEYALFNNPGALSVKTLSFVSSMNFRHISLGINDVQAGLAVPFGAFQAGIGVDYYGDQLYNQLRVVSSARHRIGFANLGMRLGYHQYYLENYGYKQTASVDIGGIFTMSEEVRLAMLITNLTRSKLTGQDDHRLSSLIALGLSYLPISSLRFNLQLTKDINLPVSGNLGLEYLINQNIAARTGFDFTNSTAALGIGFSWQQFRLDLGGQYQPRLGYSAAASIVISKKNVD